MNEDDRRGFESLFQLYDISWQHFNERRDYEFKISIGFWTVLVAAIAGSMTLAKLTIPLGNIFLILAASFVAILHGFWSWGIFISYHRDRLKAISYEDELQRIASVNLSQDAKDYIQKVRKNRCLKYWSVIFQIGVTVLLAIALVSVNWDKVVRTTSLQQSEKTKIELDEKRMTLETQKLELEIEQLRKDMQSAPQLDKPKTSNEIRRRR